MDRPSTLLACQWEVLTGSETNEILIALEQQHTDVKLLWSLSPEEAYYLGRSLLLSTDPIMMRLSV